MRKWYLPVTVIGLSGLGLLFLTDRGRRAVTWVVDNMHRAPGRLLEWNDVAQRELDRIQTALNRVAESLEAVR